MKEWVASSFWTPNGEAKVVDPIKQRESHKNLLQTNGQDKIQLSFQTQLLFSLCILWSFGEGATRQKQVFFVQVKQKTQEKKLPTYEKHLCLRSLTYWEKNCPLDNKH